MKILIMCEKEPHSRKLSEELWFKIIPDAVEMVNDSLAEGEEQEDDLFLLVFLKNY